MKEDETNWFSKWQDDLPSPEELMPMSQTLITPDLAMAFDIKNHSNSAVVLNHHVPQPPQPPISSAEFGGGDSGEMVSAAGSEEPARTLKRPRLVWTPQLHKRFVDAVAHLGIKNAVPKTIMQLMNVEGLTRENVASHLQKYRLYLKRMQGLGNVNGNGNGGSNGNGSGGSDPATDHLFASSPVPSHFLHQARGNSEHFLPYMPAAALQHPQMAMQHPQLQAVAAAATQYSRPVGHFGSVPTNAGFEHPFLSRQSQGVQRIGPAVPSNVPAWNYVEDLETENGNGDRKVLTLFPTADD